MKTANKLSLYKIIKLFKVSFLFERLYNINMKLDEILNELAEAIKLPETKEEAIDYIKKEPSCLAFVEDMAFRQVVINILVAANIISEKDFNDLILQFNTLFIDKFAEELLEKLNAARTKLKLENNDQDSADDEDDFDDWPGSDKKIYQA